MRVIGRAKIPGRVRDLEKKIDKLKSDAADFFKKTTPIRTGNARSKTKRDRDRIKADYHYATKLNEGFSRQAPDGMTNPTIEFIQDQVRKF
jgi:hypothetical protein